MINWGEFWQRHEWKIIILAIIIIIGLGLWFWWQSTRVPKTVVLQPADKTINTTTTEPLDSQVLAPTGGEATVAARNFAERFGSYSSQNPYGNIRELFPLMTNSLRSYYSGKSSPASNSYQGVESRVVTMKVVSESPSTADILVSLQRSERDNDLQSKVYYQDLRLSLVKQSDLWLVDAADWQKK